jgi:hypothetical protein
MSTKNDKRIASLFAEARRLAGVCLADSPGLPDRQEVNAIAVGLLAAGLVGSGSKGSAVNRAGADKDQDELLADAYGDKQSADEGNF